MVAAMSVLDQIYNFSPLDAFALALMFVLWAGFERLVERQDARRPSVSVLMAQYRRDWMREFVTRENRIFDVNILANLRQGTTFFASASMIAIGGALALIGNPERLSGVAENLSLGENPSSVWEIKLLPVVLLLANAFLKFVWSHRLFGYCAVMLASIPDDPADPRTRARAEKAAEINISAARSFNRGLRSLYFSLGAMAWLVGAWPLIAATLITALVLWRREYGSNSRRVLLRDDEPQRAA